MTLRNSSHSKDNILLFGSIFVIPSTKPHEFLSTLHSLTLAAFEVSWAPFSWPELQHDSNSSWHDFVEVIGNGKLKSRKVITHILWLDFNKISRMLLACIKLDDLGACCVSFTKTTGLLLYDCLCAAYLTDILLLLEDKGKAKTNSASQNSSTEAGAFLPKPGAAAAAPVTPASSSKSTNGAPSTASESEEEKAKKLLYCSLCKVAVNSLSQLEAHNTGE